MAAVSVGLSPNVSPPLRKRQIAGQDHRTTPFITFGHDLEEVIGLLAGQRQIADLIDDQQPRPQHAVAHYGVVAILPLGRRQLQHQISCRDEVGLDAGLRGGVAEGNRQMCLPTSDGPNSTPFSARSMKRNVENRQSAFAAPRWRSRSHIALAS